MDIVTSLIKYGGNAEQIRMVCSLGIAQEGYIEVSFTRGALIFGEGQIRWQA